MNKITLRVHPEKVSGTVPNYLFGHFLEYMYDCIDPGLWAELLISRGFENRDMNQSGVSFPWVAIGEGTECQIDTNLVYTPRQSQKIINRFDQVGGIQQDNLKLYESEEYKGYLWTYCEQNTSVTIKILSSSKKNLFEKNFIVTPGKWNKYEYSFLNKYSEENATIQLLIDGKGSIWLDQCSLMPMSAYNGVWKNVMEYIKPLEPSIMRFPGGCAADCYFWEDGIGQRDMRPSRVNEHWGGIEQNQFGTDEYLAFCREIGCEPLICVNFGSSTPEDAANWVEYCNGDLSTIYGRKRAENGHPEPYNVKYWEIGNEVFGTWEIGHCDAKAYIQKYKKFAFAMRQKDPNITFLACGGDGGNLNQEWNRNVLSEGKNSFDSLTLHFYAPLIASSTVDQKELYQAVVAAPIKQEQVLQLTVQTMEEVGYIVPVAVTEWNCNYGEQDKSEREQTVEALVANAGLLNVFLRNANHLNMCNVSDLVNGWSGGIIRSSRGEVFGTVTYHLIKMYAEAKPEVVLDCEYESDTYDVQALGNIEALENVPFIDIVCCKNAKKEIIVFAVNRHYSESVTIEIPGSHIKQIQRIWNEDILARNSFERPELITVEEEICNGEMVKLLPHSSFTIKMELKSCVKE